MQLPEVLRRAGHFGALGLCLTLLLLGIMRAQLTELRNDPQPADFTLHVHGNERGQIDVDIAGGTRGL